MDERNQKSEMGASRTYHRLPVRERRRERAREGGLVVGQPVGVDDDPAVLVVGGLQHEVVLQRRPPVLLPLVAPGAAAHLIRPVGDAQQVGRRRVGPEELLARRRPHPAQHPADGVGVGRAHPAVWTESQQGLVW